MPPAAAIQSFLNAGFRSAAQVEFVAIIGDEDRHPLERRRGSWVSGILFVNAFFIRYCRSEDPGLVKRTALFREEVDRPASDPVEIDQDTRRAVKP